MWIYILELLRDGSDLLDAILVSSQVAFEGFVLLFQSLQLRQTARAEILQQNVKRLD